MTMDLSQGDTWRALRRNLSSAFSSGRLKRMLEPMTEVADDMMDYLDEIHKKNNVFDVMPLFQGTFMKVMKPC